MAHHAITPYWLYRLTRPARLRLAVRRYDRRLHALRRETVPVMRAALLETMAATASVVAGIGPGSIEAEGDWSARSEILRAIAATERFCVLTDAYPYGDGEERVTGPAHTAVWEDLAHAAIRGDRAHRARRLRHLHDDSAGLPVSSVLLDIAATEQAIAGPAAAPAGAS